IMVLSIGLALADDYELSETNIVVDDKYERICVTGKIKNTGTRAMDLSYNSKIFLLSDGEEVSSEGNVTILPTQIEPEQEGYFSAIFYYDRLDDVDRAKTADDIKADFYFDPPKKPNYIYKTEVAFEDMELYGMTVPVVTAIVENDSEDIQDNINVCFIWKDKEGKIYIENPYTTRLGLYPGSKVRYYTTIDEYFVKNYNERGFDVDITNVDVIAFSEAY
ncbi:MAG: hypothetical protein GYA87_02010, partial [Christensenellaceae bacterium]|nr:hypothetical protein [Christensenellaceae bacterium]